MWKYLYSSRTIVLWMQDKKNISFVIDAKVAIESSENIKICDFT